MLDGPKGIELTDIYNESKSYNGSIYINAKHELFLIINEYQSTISERRYSLRITDSLDLSVLDNKGKEIYRLDGIYKDKPEKIWKNFEKKIEPISDRIEYNLQRRPK